LASQKLRASASGWPTILKLTFQNCGCNSVVECQLPKLNVAGSSPVTRLIKIGLISNLIALLTPA
jgi:hypothetical protein